MNENNKKLGKNCPYCGSKLKRKSNSCEYCGKPIVKDFYFQSRNYKWLLFFFFIFVVPFIIMAFIYSIFDFFAVLLCVIFACFYGGLILVVELTSRKVKMYISEEKFKVLIGKENRLFLQISWNEINEVNIIEEQYESELRRRITICTGYTIEFIGSTIQESLRLWCFNLTRSKDNQIIEKVEYFSTLKGKKVNRIKPSGKIIKLSKAKKKCSKIEKLVNKFQ